MLATVAWEHLIVALHAIGVRVVFVDVRTIKGVSEHNAIYPWRLLWLIMGTDRERLSFTNNGI